ncbi:AAA family ATPase [Candidatus Saccharibacteria bacterium]|jgi:dephospho-CoA kinase|nr:AAA family ATPase [Candidatus Saccharibacteria bacterium]
MSEKRNVKIIAFVGMPGAGKSSAVDYVSAKGYPKVYFGGVVLRAIEEAGLEQNQENEHLIREKLRAEEGKDVIVKRITKQIQNLIEAGQNRIIADGLYSWTEYKHLKKAFPGEMNLVAILAPRSLRHRRLSLRPVRPLNPNEALERDWAEIENLEKGGPIAIADHYIINDGDLNQLYEQVDRELDSLNFYKI